MKRKYSDYPDMDNIFITKRFVNKYFDDELFKGNVSLLKVDKVSKPIIVKDWNGNDLVLTDNGYSWLELYPEKNKNIAISIEKKKKNELIEIYIDICKNSGITQEGVPYFDDLYLDIVYFPNGEIKFLDEEELKNALIENEITEDEYKMAYRIALDVKEFLETNVNIFNKIIEKYLEYLEKEI